MHRTDETPLVTIGGLAELGGPLLDNVPVTTKGVEPVDRRRPDRAARSFMRTAVSSSNIER